MTRIIAGGAKGRRLDVPGSGTRPTSDRIRESIFARLESWDAVAGARVLDLFAGSGALGIEALSRGADSAVFVESAPAAARVVRANLASLGFAASGSVAQKKAGTYLGSLPVGQDFDLVFVDPPYALPEEELAALLELLAPHLDPDATVVVERDARSPEPALPPELELLSHRKWGDTAAWFIGRQTSEP